MSRAHEVFLVLRLVRLDQLIAESEALASRSSDEETLLRIKEDIARWRKSQGECEDTLRRIRLINRFVHGSLVAFCIGFALLSLVAIVQPDGQNLTTLAVGAALLLLFGSAAVYIVALIVRDFAAQGRRLWHFSLSSLLTVMTVIAIVLGMLAYSMRN